MIAAEEALARLREGNARFVGGNTRAARTGADRRAELVAEQNPFAVVLGCADSRVPPEILFDQGLGDLFVIRVAGHVATPTEVGSIEFAVTQLSTRLVVVLGHTGCGAIRAALAKIEQPTRRVSRNLRAIVDRVRPAAEASLEKEADGDTEAVVGGAVRGNVRLTVNQLRQDSEVLRELLGDGQISVVGAEYSMETGEVDFFYPA